jgi:hypothetical protein
MQYFKNLPKILYTDKNKVSTLYTNLMARVSFIPEMLNNSLNFYTYDIQDGDTPEIVAHKYYNDISRFWIVLYCNEMMDPQWDWPLSYARLTEYVDSKYQAAGVNGLHHYEKVITKTSRGTENDQTVVERFVISGEEYVALLYANPMGIGPTRTFPLPKSKPTDPTTFVDATIQPTAVTNFEYELEQNENKRNIKLLNKLYADQLESEFTKLMR